MTYFSNLSPIMVDTRHGPIECAIHGDGPTILALHGGMGGYDQSKILARAAFGDEPFRTICISRPGYLGTPLSVGCTPEEHAGACAGLLDALAIDEAFVIAASAGGPCALQFALRHSNRCRGLILISACSGQMRFPRRLILPLLALKLAARIPLLATHMRQRAERRPELIARHSIRDAALRAQTLAHLEAGPLMRALFMSTNDRVAERLPGTLNDMRQLAGISSYLLRSISTPTLVVHGTADRAVSLAHAEAVAQQVTGSEFFPIADGEHVALFTHLDVIRERVGAFMSEQSESDGSMPAHSDWARLRTY